MVLGNGNDTFEPPTIYPTNQGPSFAGPGPLAVADVNGDGIPDLLYPDYVGRNVAVRLGNGDGTFGAEETFPTAVRAPIRSRLSDLNGDGKPDLVVANAVDDTVSVLLGNGNGTFQPQKVYPVGFESVRDGGGRLQRRRHPRHRHGQPRRQHGERAAGQRRRHLRARSRSSQPEKRLARSPWAISTAMARSTSSTPIRATTRRACSWAMATAPFRSGPSSPPLHPPCAPFQVVVADVNGDGIPDIITANRSDNSVSVLLGNRDGSFQTKETFATGQAADLGGRGRLERRWHSRHRHGQLRPART